MDKLLLTVLCLAALLSSPAVAQRKTYSVTQDTLSRQYVPVPTLNRLIKAGVGLPLFRQSSASPPWKTLGFNLTVEQKILHGLTVVGSVETNYGFSRYAQLYTVEVPIGLRYYFSVGKRMTKRADRHSFFSHYVGFETHNVAFANLYYDTPNPQVQRYYRGQILDHDTNVGNYSESLNLLEYAYFRAGSQLRVARHNFLDINVAIPVSSLVYNKAEYTLTTPALVTIKYGVAW